MKGKKVKIAYQGIAGAYSEMASESYAKEAKLVKKNLEYVGCKIFDEIFDGVDKGNFTYGVIPVENSLAGSIHRNYDLLGRYNLKVVGEVYVHVNHQLLGLKNARIKDIKEVYSHYQALAQCEHNIKKFLPTAKSVEYFDTAGSADFVKKENDVTKASLASVKAGKVYGLKVLQKDFQDDKNNFTRFLVINKSYRNFKDVKIGNNKKFKTSILFVINESVVGALFKCLGCFSLREINLTKIESRPIPKSPWKIQFYLDFEGRYDDKNVVNAINNLKEYATEIKILGSYLQSIY
jgi:prephenate dehydratase